MTTINHVLMQHGCLSVCLSVCSCVRWSVQDIDTMMTINGPVATNFLGPITCIIFYDF